MTNPDTSTAAFLGIDPSLTSTGIAVIINGDCNIGLHKPPKEYSKGILRLAWHVDKLNEVIETFKPIFAAIEGPSYDSVGKHEELGQLRGVLMLTLHRAGLRYVVVPPSTLKKYGARNGAASKEKMIRAAAERWPGKTFTDDTADAAWAAHLAKAYKTPMQHLTRPQIEVLKMLRNNNAANTGNIW